MSLLDDLDRLLDEAESLGRLVYPHPRTDGKTRAVARYCMDQGVFSMPPPRGRSGVQTSVLVMDRQTRRRLASIVSGISGIPMCPWTGDQVATYCDVPIKLDERADGRRPVGLHPGYVHTLAVPRDQCSCRRCERGKVTSMETLVVVGG